MPLRYVHSRSVTSFVRRSGDLALAQRAAAVAFWLVIAAVPAGLVAINVLGLVVDQADLASRLGEVAVYLPGTLGDAVADQLLIIAARTPGTGGWDTLLVVLALWTLSTAVVTLISAVRAAYGRARANAIWLRLFGYVMGLAGVVVVGGVGFLAAVAASFGFLAIGVVGVLGIFVLAGLISTFYWLTGGYGFGWQRGLPGAMAASIGLFCIAVGLSIYADHAPTARLVYGTAAGLVVSLLATWLSVYAVLLGALFNARRLPGREPSSGSKR